MPPVVAAVAAYFAVSATMAVFIIATAVVTLASVAYSAYMMASMEAPKTPDAMRRLQTIRSSVQPHRIIYGECMTGGVVVYAQSHGEDNKYISLVVAFTGHEVEEIKEVWLNDKISTDSVFLKEVPAVPEQGYWKTEPVWHPPGVGDPVGYWTDEKVYHKTKDAIPAHFETFSTITKYLGTPDQEADELLVSLDPKPTNIISSNPSSGLNDLSISDDDGYYGTYTGVGMCVVHISIYSVGGTDTIHWSQDVYPGDGTSVVNAAFGSQTITGGVQMLVDGVSIAFDTVTGHSLGQTWEIRAFDGAPWTADCRLRGRAYVVVTLENNATAFPNGLPNIKALIRGNNQIYDPRTETTGYTDNWALCIRDYLTKPYGLNCPDGDINDTVAIEAANICDEDVELGDGTTQKRYTLNGSFTVDKTPTAIMSEMLANAFGALAWIQGQYRVLPAAYYEPDPDFHGLNPDVQGLTESDLRGEIKVRPITSMKDRFNTVRGSYISTETWQPVDFPKVTNALYKTQDGGEEIARDVQLTYVTDQRRAQRIAKIMLEKGRQAITVDFPAKWSAFPLAVGDNVPVTIALLGWDKKIFTVTDWKLSPDGGIDLSLKEDAAGCYDWASGEETTVDLAPNTILPDPRFVAIPTGLSVGEELYPSSGGNIIKSRAFFQWGDTSAAQYEAAYLPPNNTVWAPLPITTGNLCTIDDTIPGAYSFRVRGMNHLGAWGDWAVINHEMMGKLTPPPPVDSFLVSAQADGTRDFTWTMVSPPLDLAGYRIRYCSGTSGVWEDMTDLQTGLLLAAPFETNQLAAGEYTFAIVAEDTTGNQSTPSYITFTLPDPRMAGVILTASFGSLGWPGTLTGCAVDETGALVAIGTDLWSDFATATVTWDDWTAWALNPTSPIQYDHTTIDIGASAFFTPLISAVADGTATITVSTSVDGSSWTSYAAAAPVTARYLKVRVSVAGASPVLRSVTVYLSAQPVSEEINDLDTSTLSGSYRIGTGDIRLPRTKSYSVIQSVQIALQGTGAGWTWKLIDKTSTYGPRIQIYNGSGVLADATIDAAIRGL